MNAKTTLSPDIMEKYSLHFCPPKPGCICDGENGDARQSEFDWSFIDSIFCICLKNRNDRLSHSMNQFHKYGLCTRVIYHRPEVPSKEIVEKYNLNQKGKYGAWEAHRQVTWIAHNIIKSRFNLIFEDDVLFLPHFTPAILQKVKHHLNVQLPLDWEVYCLGHMPLYGNRFLGNNLWRVHSNMCHAWIQNKPFIEKFSQMPWPEYGRAKRLGILTEIGSDSWVMTNAKQYAYSPMLAVQGDLRSDASPDTGRGIYEAIIRFHGRNPKLIEFIFMVLPYFLLLCLIVILVIWVWNKVKCNEHEDTNKESPSRCVEK